MKVTFVLWLVFMATSLAEDDLATFNKKAEIAFNQWSAKMAVKGRFQWISDSVGGIVTVRYNFMETYKKVHQSIEDFKQNKTSFWQKLNEWAAFSDKDLKQLDPHESESELSDDVSPYHDESENQKKYLQAHKGINSSFELVKATPFVVTPTVVRRSVDWRLRNTITHPVDDHPTCNASYAHAVASTVSAHTRYHTAYGVAVSGQQFIDCSFGNAVVFKDYTPCQNNKYGFNGPGDAVVRAYKFSILNGLMNRQAYAYNEKDSTKAQPCKFKKDEVHSKIDGYAIIPRGFDAEIALMIAVAHYGPVTVSIGFRFEPEFLRYGGGIYDLPCYRGKTLTMVVVGYGEDNGKPYWLVQNNWGEDWGQFGMIKIARHAVTGCDLTHQAVFPLIGPFKSPAHFSENWNFWPNYEAKVKNLVDAKYPKKQELELPNWPTVFGTDTKPPK